MKDGTYRDLVHPLDKSTRERLEEEVIDEYKKRCIDTVGTVDESKGSL